MTASDQVDIVFAQDEMSIIRCKKNWTREDLLKQEGLFFFKDVCHLLQITAPLLKQRVELEQEKGLDTWKTLGVRKVWTHWLLRMKTFAPVYRAEMEPVYHAVAIHWDANQLLCQKGIYLLSDVCKKIPFSTHQLRYQSKKYDNPSQEIGVWKDSEIGTYLVNMERFGPWLQKVWLEEPVLVPKKKKKATPRRRRKRAVSVAVT